MCKVQRAFSRQIDPSWQLGPFVTLTGSDCERIINAGTEKLSCRVSQVRVTTDAQEWVRGR